MSRAVVVWVALALALESSIPGAAGGGQSKCKPKPLAGWPERPPRRPLAERPNFVVVLVDDLGYDDAGLLHPRAADGNSSIGARTPNIDRLIRQGQMFLNLYTAQVCAESRAQLLTGRDFPRTGNIGNGGGLDAPALAEALMSSVLGSAGYLTGHLGKWHNGGSLGYNPWDRGFNDSWVNVKAFDHIDPLLSHNGQLKMMSGLLDQVLANLAIGFMKQREADGNPFLLYFAASSIHRYQLKDDNGVDFLEPYVQRFSDMKPQPPRITLRAWAYLLYFDEVMGKLIDFIEGSSLANNTYVLLMGDNGPGAGPSMTPEERQARMPSKMLGSKSETDAEVGRGGEGGVRNRLVIAGPGLRGGFVDDTPLALDDVLPTLAEMGGATGSAHLPWSGLSFANLLRGEQPTQQQLGRFKFMLATPCTAVDAVIHELPKLGEDRRVLKPQAMLAYKHSNASWFKACIVGWNQQYKYFGSSDRVFAFGQGLNGSHVELPCNEVKGRWGAAVAARFDSEAESWWESVVAEPFSFEKPVYQIGLRGDSPTLVEASGVRMISLSRVALTRRAKAGRGGGGGDDDDSEGAGDGTGLTGFSQPGDKAFWRVNVAAPGRYGVSLLYSSRQRASFRISVGTFAAIQANKAPKRKAVLPRKPSVGRQHYIRGSLLLPASSPDGVTELCLELLSADEPGSPVFDKIVFISLHPENATMSRERDARSAARFASSHAAAGLGGGSPLAAGLAQAVVLPGESDWCAEHEHLNATAAMREVELRACAALELQHWRTCSKQAPSSASGAAGSSRSEQVQCYMRSRLQAHEGAYNRLSHGWDLD